MPLIARLLRWTATPAGRRVLFVATTATVLALACNPLLLPLLPVVDAIGLDVLAVLLGAQALALLPWLCSQAARGMDVGVRALVGVFAGCAGGYLRQLLFGAARGTGLIAYARHAGA